MLEFWGAGGELPSPAKAAALAALDESGLAVPEDGEPAAPESEDASEGSGVLWPLEVLEVSPEVSPVLPAALDDPAFDDPDDDEPAAP